LETQNQTHPFWLSDADRPTVPNVVAAVSNNNPRPLTLEERRILLNGYARTKIDAACATEKATKELIEHFDKFNIGERQEEEDSASDSSSKDNLTLAQLASRSNVVGNPAKKKNQRQRRLQPSQISAPTTTGSKKKGRETLKQNKEKKKTQDKKNHGRS
jgi:hypothetical protein